MWQPATNWQDSRSATVPTGNINKQFQVYRRSMDCPQDNPELCFT
jgi:hypothetical protein